MKKVQDLFSRFKDAGWFQPITEKKAFIIGAGGIGSWTAFSLSRTNIGRIAVIDYDTIEYHNIGGQFFKPSQIENKKVNALQKNILEFSNITIDVIETRYDATSISGFEVLKTFDFAILAVDNIETRKGIANILNNKYDEIIENNPNLCIIDPRLEADFFQIYTIIPALDKDKNILSYYMENAFNIDNTAKEMCTFKQTTYMAMHIAARITGIILAIVSNNSFAENTIPIPYYEQFYFLTQKQNVSFYGK